MRFRDALISAWRAGSLAICFVVPLACLADDDPKPAPKTAHPSPMTASPGHFLVNQVLNPIGQQLQLLGVGNINLPRRSQLNRSYAPLRHVNFLGGDRVMAETLCHDGERVELRLLSGQKTIVRRETIASISGPVGEQQLLYEAFEQNPSSVTEDDSAIQRPVLDPMSVDHQQAASGRSSLKLTSTAGPVRYILRDASDVSAVQFWFRVDPDPIPRGDRPSDVNLNPTSSALRVDFDFAAGDASAHWALRTTKNGLTAIIGQVEDSNARQSTLLDPGWHCLTATITADHTTISVDDSLLLSTSGPPGKLQSIHFASDLIAWIDDLQIRGRTVTEHGAGRVATDDDCVTLHNSDQFYGKLQKVDANSVVLSRAGSDVAIPWSRITTIWFRQSDHAVSGASPSARGQQIDTPENAPPAISNQDRQWATVEFQSSLNFPHQNPDRLQVTVLRSDPECLLVWHPFLGQFAIGWNQVARIESHFFGGCLVLDARLLHLGDSIREDFRRPLPDGTHWSREFDLPAPLPADVDVWLTMDVVDLEPSGAGTPPASPFLKELRSGRLVTQIKVNQESAGDLNRRIRFRSSPQSPERLRCRLPTGALSVGRNKLSLTQLPRNDSRTGFDNCELSNLRLEFISR